MAIDPLTAITPNDGSAFPDNAAINATSPSATDGTPLTAISENNYKFGRQQALLNYAGLTPTGVVESDTVSQELEAIQKGFGVGVGKFVRWFLKDDPSVTGDRVLLLSGQGVLRASYPLLDAAIYVGDPDNPTALDRYHADDAAGTIRNIAGVYLILPESRDYVFPNGPRMTTSHWDTVNGYGSSSTAIQKFTNEIVASDDVVVTVVNSATLGFIVTANMDCKVSMNYTCNLTAAGNLGISKNSNQLTTSIASITSAHRKSSSYQAGAGTSFLGETKLTIKLEAGDILRTHADKQVDGAIQSITLVQLTATELPRENTDTIMGITY